MKITFFLTPKAEVAWVASNATIRQTLERMERRHYSAIPVLSPDGRYDSTLTEGDLLWYLKDNPHVSFKDTERIRLAEVPRRMLVRPIDISADIEELFTLALEQNFVPVIDDRKIFIGIVTRKSILNFYAETVSYGVAATP